MSWFRFLVLQPVKRITTGRKITWKVQANNLNGENGREANRFLDEEKENADPARIRTFSRLYFELKRNPRAYPALLAFLSILDNYRSLLFVEIVPFCALEEICRLEANLMGFVDLLKKRNWVYETSALKPKIRDSSKLWRSFLCLPGGFRKLK